ncbi:hypothetical protein Tco_0983692 [Tanacetum coccineum]
MSGTHLVAGERIPYEASPASIPQRQVAGDTFPQRHVARERGDCCSVLVDEQMNINVVDIECQGGENMSRNGLGDEQRQPLLSSKTKINTSSQIAIVGANACPIQNRDTGFIFFNSCKFGYSFTGEDF